MTTNSNVIKLKNSGIVSNVPVSLEHGELALNYADKKLFYKDSTNTIVDFTLSSSATTDINAGFVEADIYEAEVTNIITDFYDGGEI